MNGGLTRLKFWSCVGVFATSSAFLGLSWIDSAQWITIAITCLGIFGVTHTATDIASIVTGGNK